MATEEERDDLLSRQYHSIRIYDGTGTIRRIPYRIGNNSTTVPEETEHFYDTWTDFHLIPAERPTVELPGANTKIVSIPGRTIPYDLTEYLTGHTTYSNRTGSWSFLTDPDWVEQELGGWLNFDRQLRSLFHGHVSKIVLRDDPSYFYYGQLTLAPWNTGDVRSQIQIGYDLYPYKKQQQSSMEHWHFDEFEFDGGMILYLKDLAVSQSRDVLIYGGTERISPHISGTAGLTVLKNEDGTWVNYGSVPSADISAPESIIPRLVIDEGANTLRFTGTGTVTIDYRRGVL